MLSMALILGFPKWVIAKSWVSILTGFILDDLGDTSIKQKAPYRDQLLWDPATSEVRNSRGRFEEAEQHVRGALEGSRGPWLAASERWGLEGHAGASQ